MHCVANRIVLEYMANGTFLQAFENTSTNVAAAQMRNSLTNLAETVKDPEQKKASSQRNRPKNPTVSTNTTR